jgi:hypothetical protein
VGHARPGHDELTTALAVITAEARADLLKAAPECANAIRRLPDELLISHPVTELLTRVRATTKDSNP